MEDKRADAVIGPDQAAFVVGQDGRISLVLPRQDLDAPVSAGHRLLLAIAMRIDADPDWVEEMIRSACKGERPQLGFIPFRRS